MRYLSTIFLLAGLAFTSSGYAAEDRIELETTRIKANQELPQILYVVPWKDMESSKEDDQKLVLHNFFGDLYDPVLPGQSITKDSILAQPSD
jgi:hypothetical protein